MAWLVVTDLDNTLLDDSYPLAEAASAIDAVSSPDVMVVLASSKTVVEMIGLAELCENHPMLVFENGGGLAWREPVLSCRGGARVCGYELEVFGEGYPELRRRLAGLRRHPLYEFRGFGDMTAAEIAALTGLAASDAEAAKRRMTTEPILWEGDEVALASFRADLERLDLRLERGGRFHHVGYAMTKARAVRRMLRLLDVQNDSHPTTLACGDAPNDFDMLEGADYALVFPCPSGRYLLPAGDRVFHAKAAGPASWLAGVTHVLRSFEDRP